MIITVTLNAALDRSVTVPIFQLGHRHRASEVLVLAGGKGMPPWWVFAFAVPLSMVGTVAGGYVLDRLSDVNFKRYLRLIVTAIGAVYMVQAVRLYLG